MKLGAMEKWLKIAGAIPFTLDIPPKKSNHTRLYNNAWLSGKSTI
jgi:hypothetical protein